MPDDEERDAQEVYALLRHLDHPLPQIDAATVAVAARARDFGWARWAASIVLALGVAGAAYAAPGSPVRAWIAAAMERIGGRTVPATSDRGVAGIAVPVGQRLVILFTTPDAAGQARVSLSDSMNVVVRALTGAATFTSDIDRLVIDNRGAAATFDIRIPRVAPHVEIHVAGDRIFLKEGSRITTTMRTQTEAPYLLRLAPAGP